MASIYMQSLSADNGRPTIDIRLAVGALILKHKLKLSDREVVSTIRENVYIQYFVGYRSFDPDVPFDPSLFVEMRKRMGAERFDEMSKQIIRLAKGPKKTVVKDSSSADQDEDGANSGPTDLGSSLDNESAADPDQSKDKTKVEFGAKLGVSEWDGFSRIDHLSWDAYNECGDLEVQASA